VQELAPEIAARIAEAERIAAEAEAEAAAYAEHAAAIQLEHELQQEQEHQVHPLTCLSFELLKHLQNVETSFYCPQTFLYDFQFGDDIPGLKRADDPLRTCFELLTIPLGHALASIC